MRHHTVTVANIDPVKPVNGKKLVWLLGVGAVLFTFGMGFGTYFLAKIMAPMLQKHPAPSSQQVPKAGTP